MKCCMSSTVDVIVDDMLWSGSEEGGTVDDMLWSGSEEGGTVQSECEGDKGTASEDGDSNTDW